jgi:plastocyanin
MRVHLLRVRLLLAVALAVVGCGDSGTTPPSGTSNKTVDIYLIGDTFSPTFPALAVGDTARWNFAAGSDGMGHNVRFSPRIAGSPADINVFKTGTVWRVFTTKGTFNYVCDVHPGMDAQVIVQ